MHFTVYELDDTCVYRVGLVAYFEFLSHAVTFVNKMYDDGYCNFAVYDVNNKLVYIHDRTI